MLLEAIKEIVITTLSHPFTIMDLYKILFSTNPKSDYHNCSRRHLDFFFNSSKKSKSIFHVNRLLGRRFT